MDKAKHQPIAAEKKKESSALVEFVAPYPLPDCVLRIRDTKSLDKGFMSAGFDPSYEKVEPGVYRFKIKRTWYDTRYRRQTSTVALEGYLKGIDATSTVVIAKTKVSMITPIIITVLVGLMILSGIFAPQKAGSGFIFFIGGTLMLTFYGLMLWSDRRSLVKLIHRAMSDDLL